MEPVITCLDEATWLDNFRPEDITIGAVISFQPTEECGFGDDDGYLAHRVKDIKVEDGVYYYWPQGDNNLEPDNCWIPEDNVDGYIIELHKDVRPEKSELRNAFNEASAREAMAREAYDIASTEYDDYCATWTSEPGDCVVSDSKYQRAKELFDKVETARLLLIDAIDDLDCWLSAALSDSYLLDGDFHLVHACFLNRIEVSPLS